MAYTPTVQDLADIVKRFKAAQQQRAADAAAAQPQPAPPAAPVAPTPAPAPAAPLPPPSPVAVSVPAAPAPAPVPGGAYNIPGAIMNYFGTSHVSQPGQNLVTVHDNYGHSVTVNQAAAADTVDFLNDLQARGYHISDLGGYSPRNMRGGHQISEHAYGGGFDMNPGQNPGYGSTQTDMPADMGQIAANHGFIWGGLWKDPNDPMHVQWAGPEASRLAAERRARGETIANLGGGGSGLGNLVAPPPAPASATAALPAAPAPASATAALPATPSPDSSGQQLDPAMGRTANLSLPPGFMDQYNADQARQRGALAALALHSGITGMPGLPSLSDTFNQAIPQPQLPQPQAQPYSIGTNAPGAPLPLSRTLG